MSTFNELIDFTRSTTGTYLDSVVYGDDKANAFAGSGGPTWTVVDKNTVSGTQPTSLAYFTGIASGLTIGAQYKIELTVTNYAGVDNFGIGSSGGVGSLVRLAGNGTITSFFTATAGHLNAFMRDTNSGTINVSVKEIIGGQVSAGTPLLRTAAINEPRLEYDASGNPLGLLIEEGRTNVLAYSKDFTAGWSGYVISSTTNAIATPDGAVSGAKLQEDSSGTGGPRFYPNANAVLTANQAQTFSCFFKAGTSNYAYVTIRHTNQNIAGAEFDLANGTVNSTQDNGNMTVNGSDIRSVGNGWYRCSVTATCSVSTNSGLYLLGLTDGTGILNGGYPFYTLTGKNIYAWGSQAETGAFPTSYIPTSGSTVTRAADIASLPVERFAFNATKGSVVVSAETLMTSGSKGIASIEGNSSAENIGLFRGATGNLVYEVRSGSTTQAVFSVSPQVNTFKVAYVFANNYFNIAVNGVAQTSDTSGVVPTGLSAILIGGVYTAGDQYRTNGHIKQIQYYPKRLSNEELQLLTQPSASPTMNLTFDGQATSTLVEGLHD